MQFIPVSREEYFKVLSKEDAVTAISSFDNGNVIIVWETRKYRVHIGKSVSDDKGMNKYYLTRYFWNKLQKNKEN